MATVRDAYTKDLKEDTGSGLIPMVRPVSATGAPAWGEPNATATITSVNDQATTVQLVAANANRRGGSIVNDSTSILYVLLGSGSASTTNFTVAIDGKTTVPGYYDIPANYTGAIQGIWSADSSGAARITEISA